MLPVELVWWWALSVPTWLCAAAQTPWRHEWVTLVWKWSPILNPVENLWNKLGQRLPTRRSHQTRVSEFTNVPRESLFKIPVFALLNLEESYTVQIPWAPADSASLPNKKEMFSSQFQWWVYLNRERRNHNKKCTSIYTLICILMKEISIWPLWIRALVLGANIGFANTRGQTCLVVGQKFCTHLRVDFVPLLSADLQVINDFTESEH